MADAKTLHHERFNIVRQNEAGFDRACEAAWRLYRLSIGMDDDGYARKVDGFCRTTDDIVVEFVGYASRNCEHVYDFWGRVERIEGDE